VGPGKAGLNAPRSFLARSAGLAMSRWDGGRGDLGQSAGGGYPHSAEHVEAPDPDIIMRRFATSERTMTPAMHQSNARKTILPQPRSRRLRNPASSNGTSATFMQLES
jgi:hypothetical protein